LLDPQPSLVGEAEQASPEQRHHRAGKVVDVLGDLFPEAEPGQPRLSRGLTIVISVVAVLIGAIALLLRIPGLPAWKGMYAEDYWLFFPQALENPWHLLTPDGGYIEFVPRVIASLVTYLPLADAAAAFAIIGALIAAGCALFIFHASAGFIKSGWLRGLLAAAVVLLPVAPLEIPDSGVGAPWYLLIALFWAMLWRPRSNGGKALAAVIGFLTAASTILSIVLLPLLLVRVFVLRRFRDHWVTAGWVVGLLVQAPFVIQGITGGNSRASKRAPFHQVVAFYGHDVILPALGWHVSWWLKNSVGPDYGMIIIGGLLAIIFAVAIITQSRLVRVFVVTALAIGFLETVVAGTLTWWVSGKPVTIAFEPGSRYTDLPILLIDAALIIAVDAFIRRTPIRMRAVTAVVALVALLGVGWVTDFREAGNRSNAYNWSKFSTAWLSDCATSTTGSISDVAVFGNHESTLPCDRLNR
jgi:hypothetical protein